ncbi:hypothetical protein EDD91_1690 [Streptomyces sp. KS 21]|nr:hypothetical protein EDD91_1690 [Streptomyces sp. KS 21]
MVSPDPGESRRAPTPAPGRSDEHPMPPHLEGVGSENWQRLLENERVRRAALDAARRHVEAELARPRERNLSNLGVTAVAAVVFGVIAVALFATGFGQWSILPLALLVPAFLLALRYALLVLRAGTQDQP